MREVASGLFMTLDGITESPERWQLDYFDDDMMAAMASCLATEDTVLLGRVTYQEWADYWPTSTDEPYASHINNVPKYVVSTTLDKVAWGKWDNIGLIKKDLAGEVDRLKRQPGNRIGVAGSPTLARSMLRDDLLDELTLMIHPVVVGNGKHLFRSGDRPKRLKLVDCTTTRSGVAILTYHREQDR
jgi:dihydrofolate reductase